MAIDLKGKKGKVFLVGGVAAVGAFLWYRHSQSTAAAAPAAGTADTSTTDPNIDPATGVPYADETGGAIDPNTGVPYADESGAAYQGTSAIDPATGVPYADESGGGGVTGTTGATGPAGPAGPAGPGAGGAPVASTNAQWAQDAEDHLGGGATVSAALHKYIAGGALTPEQESVANSAIAYMGYPPKRGTGGFPPAMKTQPAAGQGGGGKKTTITATGKFDLQATATGHGITEKQLVAWNPGLKRLEGSGKPIPKGTRVIV